MISIEDNSILERFVQDEMEDPTPRKHIDGYTIYASRIFRQPKTFGDAVISDLGEAEDGKLQRHHNAQPNWYRSPEVMLKADWSYPADIWNVGAMVGTLWCGFDMPLLTFTRYGICSKEKVCFSGTIRSSRYTRHERTLQRSSAC